MIRRDKYAKIKGAFPVLITPMDEFQEINWDGVKQNVNYFIEQKVAGVIINGSTGEFVSLSKEERFKMVETVLKEIDAVFQSLLELQQRRRKKQLNIRNMQKRTERIVH